MCSWSWIMIAASLISTAAEPSVIGAHVPQVLSSILEPAVRARMLNLIGQQADGEVMPLTCGYFCDSDAAEVHRALAKALELTPRQLGDFKLVNTNEVNVHPSHHVSWAAVAVVFLDYPSVVNAPTFLDAYGSKIPLTWPNHLEGSAIVMPVAASVAFPSSLKLAIVPVLEHPRSVSDYYIGSEIWQALVSTHRTSSVLGLSFFRAHSKYPLYWHACVWSGLGAAMLTLLGFPFLYKPLVRLAMAIEKRLGRGKTEDDESMTESQRARTEDQGTNRFRPYMGTFKCTARTSLLSLPIDAVNGDNEHRIPRRVASKPSHGCPSPMTPGMQQISFNV